MQTYISSETGFQTLLLSFSTAFVAMFQLRNVTFARLSCAVYVLLDIPVRTK